MRGGVACGIGFLDTLIGYDHGMMVGGEPIPTPSCVFLIDSAHMMNTQKGKSLQLLMPVPTHPKFLEVDRRS